MKNAHLLDFVVHFQDFINWPIWTPEEIIEEKKINLHGLNIILQ